MISALQILRIWHDTHRSPCDEVGELDHLPRVGVNKGLVELVLSIVLDLHNVREGERAVLPRDPFEGDGMRVVLARECILSLRDSSLCRNGRRRGRNGRWKARSVSLTWKHCVSEGRSQGVFTNELLKETTLLSLLKATLATALATGTPF